MAQSEASASLVLSSELQPPASHRVSSQALFGSRVCPDPAVGVGGAAPGRGAAAKGRVLHLGVLRDPTEDLG